MTMVGTDSTWAHFHRVFDSSSDCLLLVQAESGQIVCANPSLERQLGAAQGAWQGKPVTAVPALCCVARSMDEFHAFASEISHRPRELTLRHSRGEDIHFHARALPYTVDGRPYLLLTFRPQVIDTRSSATLMKSTWLARMVFENAPDGINVRQLGADLKSKKLLGCNQRFCEMTGYTESQLMAMDDITRLQSSLLSPEEEAENDRKVLELQPVSGIATWLRPDGRENYFEWRGVPMRVGDAIYVLGIDRDITVQRKALEELRAKTAELDALINNIPDLVWFKDAHSRYIACNAAFCKATGKSLDDLRGRTDLDISPTDIARKYQEDDARVVRTRKGITVEEKHELKGQPTRWIVTTKSPILDKDGKVLGTVGIARDITDRRAAELANLEHRAHLEAILKRIPLAILQKYKVESSAALKRVVVKRAKKKAAKKPATKKPAAKKKTAPKPKKKAKPKKR
jgi:PAS domain S-box-containing protein